MCCPLHLYQTSIVVMFVTIAPDQQACIFSYTQPAVKMVKTMQHEDNFFRGCCFLLVHCIENSSFSLWCLYYIFFKVNCFRLLIKKDWYFEQTLKVFSDIVRSVYPGIYHFTFLTECFPKVGLFKRLIWFYQIRPKLVHGLTDTIIRTKKTTTKNITITKTRVCYFFRAVYQNKNHVIPHPDIAAILDVILNILPR